MKGTCQNPIFVLQSIAIVKNVFIKDYGDVIKQK